MRWLGRQQSGNVDDRRGGGGGGRMAVGGGIGGIVIVVIALLLGKNPLEYIDIGQQPTQSYEQPVPSGAADEEGNFVKVVLKDTEDAWGKIFQEQLGADYQEPVLVLFTNTDQSGCGFASAATGPFYCPADQKVYIDLSFYDQLKDRFGAPGDFAMAYVIAHEVGHHVQHLLGVSTKVHRAQQSMTEREANALSVKLELQADFYAGVWAHYAKEINILEAGDIEEALQAANAIGDDNLQKQSQGYVVPDAFTHGTSEQRMYWFKRGFESGNLKDGNTFNEVD
ncbi:KPN_02809 family neutral zinc metallopeptidase [Pseudochryseolinea flava]|uniref:Metalloprotease n=1 Tax=Pseudochryseolinea flava TaxID=2059302 RepID=A0A364Y3P7_9BACT|nr:neutral zinc metallopeptidase [Pseudochryseolinea flava]RAW01406.1 metalloprotease [Pseudochryseolinea flava]